MLGAPMRSPRWWRRRVSSLSLSTPRSRSESASRSHSSLAKGNSSQSRFFIFLSLCLSSNFLILSDQVFVFMSSLTPLCVQWLRRGVLHQGPRPEEGSRGRDQDPSQSERTVLNLSDLGALFSLAHLRSVSDREHNLCEIGFLIEVRDHPNIVQTLAACQEEDGEIWCVMEYLRGGISSFAFLLVSLFSL